MSDRTVVVTLPFDRDADPESVTDYVRDALDRSDVNVRTVQGGDWVNPEDRPDRIWIDTRDYTDGSAEAAFGTKHTAPWDDFLVLVRVYPSASGAHKVEVTVREGREETGDAKAASQKTLTAYARRPQ